MRDDLDLIFSKKNSDIESISEKYPAAGNKEKEKIYKISKRKYDILKSQEAEADDDDFAVKVEGVERYRKPRLISAICGAAASVILICGVSGAFLFGRANKINNLSEVTTVPPEAATNTIEKESSTDMTVDELADSLECIMKAQYLGKDSISLDDSLEFSIAAYDDKTGGIISRPLYYYKVTDERIDTFDKLANMLESSFGIRLRTYWEGNDLSQFESGTDFGDDSEAMKHLRTFITYKDELYVLSALNPLASYAFDPFENYYNFSEYDMISSDYTKSGEGFEGDLGLDERYRDFYDDETASMVCSRIYRRQDGELVYADFLLKEIGGIWKLADYSIIDEYGKEQKAREKEEEVETTTAPAIEIVEELAELSLHEPKIFSSEEEMYNSYKDRKKELSEKSVFHKVDTEMYAQQILDARSSDELNTLENKSYIYHLMLNSKYYFDTAEGSAESSMGDHIFCIDNRSRKYYTYTGRDRTELYSDGENVNNVFLSEGNYTSNKLVDSQIEWLNSNIPDNDRVLFVEQGGRTVPYPDPMSHLLENIGMDYMIFLTLYPDAVLCDFNTWRVEGTAEICGRQCVNVILDTEQKTSDMYIDLRTGIVLKYDDEYPQGTRENFEIKEIKINEPVKVKEFDPTGLVQINLENKNAYLEY